MTEPVLLIVLPLVGSLSALAGKLLPARKTFTALALLPLGAMAVVLGRQLPAIMAGSVLRYALGGYAEGPGITLILDGPAWLASMLIVLISSLVAIFSLEDRQFDLRYFFFLLMLVVGMETVVLTGDIFTMFVGFEVVALSAYVLIAWERSSEGLLASLKYLFLSSVGILFFLLGVFVVYRDMGTLSLAGIAEYLATLPGGAVGGSIPFALAALCVGIGVRTAFIPFHTWLPEAHAWAPHPVSALLSGVLIKVSFFVMFRILAVFGAFHIYPMLTWLGAITALVAVGWALAQSDAKRLLAYHSISQMGYILAAAGALTAFSVPAAYTHAINHAIFKSLLFLAAGHAIHLTGERNLFRIGPLGRRAPLVAAALVVGALSIAGVPPFNGFVSKQLISEALYGSPAYVLLRITAVGTTASFIKLSRIALLGPRPVAGELVHNDHRSTATAAPLVILSVLALFTGVAGSGYTRFVWRLVGGGAMRGATPPMPSFFALDKLTDSLVTLALGIVTYLLVMTPPGKRVSHRVRRIAPHLRTVLVFFVFGLALFSVAALL
ncbi:MAG: hypothetical protein MI724_15360 [Spirochaetales bacterium]|nr:hypothetical protein [Spirochaetales bacterium]